MSKAVGIDLGTTNSVVSVLEGGDPVVIPNAEGSRTTPSVVAFSKSGEVLVGEVAKRQAITNPDRTFRSIKRHMGEDWRSEDVDGKRYTPQEISARILMKLKNATPRATSATPSRRRSSPVPAYFDDAQRTATKEAGQIAGLEVLRDHQRAHRRGAGLRPRQGGPGRDRPRVRPRRRHVRRVRAGRSATVCSRSSRPTATPTSAVTTGTSGSDRSGWCSSSSPPTASTWRRTGWPPSASRRPPRRPRSPQPGPADADQPAVHHRHRRRSAAPRRVAQPLQVPGDDR